MKPSKSTGKSHNSKRKKKTTPKQDKSSRKSASRSKKTDLSKQWQQRFDPFADREAKNYADPIPSREHILDYLSHAGQPVLFKQIANALKLFAPDRLDALKRRLRAMQRDGQLLKNRKSQYCVIDQLELIRGRVIGHRDGYGFVNRHDSDGPDLFLSANEMRQVLHDDDVLVRVACIDRRGRQEATIVEVLSHNTQEIVGKYHEESGIGFITPSNKRIARTITVTNNSSLSVTPGQSVAATLIQQPGLHQHPIAKISEVLESEHQLELITDIAIRSYQLPFRWPEAASTQAATLPDHVSTTTINERRDLRKLPFVTIDGADAKDFDDAIYCEVNPKGGWQLYVAIADVSYYVKPNSPLDHEAQQRGNSVYFPGQVIPMLPEALSNGLCSLRPNVDRLCLVCEMAINSSGKITRSRFYHAVIHSHARLTYDEVSDLLTDQHSQAAKQYVDLNQHLQQLHTLYQILLTVRSTRGAIDFEFNEPYFEFDDQGQISAIKIRKRTVAHRIIEECMLAANVCAARFLVRHKKPSLFRIHSKPSEDKLTQLREFLGMFSLNLSGGKQPTPADYAKLLQTVVTRADAMSIQMVILRSLTQAVYGPENEGHFALAYDAYGHFTSPIRRYPDLIVHRTISHIINRESDDEFPYTNADMVNLGEHCSMTERRADDATRDVNDWLKCEFMQDKIGQRYSGVITGVVNFGLFVQLDDIFIDGLIHIATLPKDYYHFDATTHCLIGKHSRRCYRLGDEITVIVSRVNSDTKQIELDITATTDEHQ